MMMPPVGSSGDASIHSNFQALISLVHEDLEAEIVHYEHTPPASTVDVVEQKAQMQIHHAYGQYLTQIQQKLNAMEERVRNIQFGKDEVPQLLQHIGEVKRDIGTYEVLLFEQLQKERAEKVTIPKIINSHIMDMQSLDLQLTRIDHELKVHLTQVESLQDDSNVKFRLMGCVPTVVAVLSQETLVQVPLASGKTLPISEQFCKDLQRGTIYNNQKVSASATELATVTQIVQDLERRGISHHEIQQIAYLCNQTLLNIVTKYALSPLLAQAYNVNELLIRFDSSKFSSPEAASLYELNIDSAGGYHVDLKFSFKLTDPDSLIDVNKGDLFISVISPMNANLLSEDVQVVIFLENPVKPRQ